jgi:gluconolactonase
MKKLLPLLLVAAACSTTKDLKTPGSIERLDPALDVIIATDAKVEVIARGYTWSEGPVWVDSLKMLLFSDVPENVV